MAIIQGNAKKSTAAGGFYPKVINGSLRFNDDDSAYLSWTPDSAGNRKTWTLSLWTKRGRVDNANRELFGTASEGDKLSFTDSRIFWFNNGSSSSYLSTTALFRDPSAWYHIVLAFDTTQATASNRVKLYVNGEQVAFDNNTTFPTQNYDGDINNAEAQFIGMGHGGTGSSYDGYLANVHFLNGIAATADDFGELKNGVWVAKDYEGLFDSAAETALGHANGFYLTFEDDTEVEAFNTLIWRGDSSTSRDITGTGFAPDFVWIKDRNTARGSVVFDVIRGQGNYLRTNETTQESTSATPILTAFNSDGFTLGNNAAVNNSNETYVAWGWKAGGAPTVDNSAGAGNVPTAGSVKIDGVNSTSALAGSIPATRLSASTTYGFSIVSYTGTGSAATIGHGLSSAPDLIICKNRDELSHWDTYHSSIGSAYRVQLSNTTAQEGPSTVYWNSTDPTSSVFSVGNGLHTNGSGDKLIAYCWSETTGYSKFGSYTGGTANYKVTTGFKPAMVIVKRTDSTSDWQIFDNTRDVSNPITARLNPNQSYAELTNGNFDIVDDGFELNDTSAGWNGSGGTYIYAAFADTREAAFWLDQSGNDNDWQPVNLDHNDTVSDSPTDNFCTWNPLNKGTNLVTSDGNLSVNNSATEATHRTCVATHGMTSGKYYWEIEVNNSANVDMVGIVGQNATINSGHVGTSGFGYGYNTTNGNWYKASGWADDGTTPAAFPTSGTIGVAFDADNKKIYFSRNGVWINNANPTAGTGANGTYTGSETVFFPAISIYSNTGKWVANFGQQPFKYDPPA